MGAVFESHIQQQSGYPEDGDFEVVDGDGLARYEKINLICQAKSSGLPQGAPCFGYSVG